MVTLCVDEGGDFMMIGEAARLRILGLCRERNMTVNRLSGVC